MASLRQCKVHNMSGSYRMVVPPEWKKQFGVQSKQALDVIVSNALIVLPPRTLTEDEVEEVIRDMKQLMKARNLLH